jgi:hypothetical protein
MAALFTSTSTREALDRAFAARACSPRRTSTGRRGPQDRRVHSAATASACSPRMSAATTCAPSRAKRSAYALPIPCAAPVTIAIRSLSRIGAA